VSRRHNIATVTLRLRPIMHHMCTALLLYVLLICARNVCHGLFPSNLGSYTQLKAAAIKDCLGGQSENVRSMVLTKLQVRTIVPSMKNGSRRVHFFIALAEGRL
jgi:hypothetical protein